MNIWMYEIRAGLRTSWLWSCALAAVSIFFLSVYPSIAGDFDQFRKLMEGFPEQVRNAIGLKLDSMGTLLGYYSYTMMYLTIGGAIQAMNAGVSIISKEFREKTADFLFTKPISRTKVLTSKLLAALVQLLLTNLCYLIAAMIMAIQVGSDDFEAYPFILLSLTLLFVQLIFLALGSLVATLFTRIKSVISVSLPIVFGFYFIGMFASTDGDQVKRYLSPFKLFDAEYIIEHTGYETSYAFTGLGIVLAAIVVSYFIYAKKDIHSV